MRQYITASGMVGTDLTPEDIFISIQTGRVEGDVMPAGLDYLHGIADNPNVCFRHPDLSIDALECIFPDTVLKHTYITDMSIVSDSYACESEKTIVIGYQDINRRMGCLFIAIPFYVITTFERNVIIDEILKTL